MAPRKKGKQNSLEQLLQRLYYNPKNPGSYGGVRNLWREARKSRPKLKEEAVEAWLSTQATYTLHKPVRYKFTRKRVVVGGIDHQWQADLADVSSIKKDNQGYCYLLTCIDVFSKYAWVVPLTRKTGPNLVEAFANIFAEGRKPQTLQTDQGTEFKNEKVQTLLKEEKVHFFTTYNVETKASVVERFNRTIKSRMWRYFTENNTLTYTTILPSLVHAYNHSFHRSIGRAPAEVTPENEEVVWQKLYAPSAAEQSKAMKMMKKKQKKKKKKKLEAGDWVRLSKAKRTFKKGYLPNWTEELFSIVRIIGVSHPCILCRTILERCSKGVSMLKNYRR